MDTVRTKKCTKCGEVKNLETEFYKDKSKKDGYLPRCKECDKKQSNQWKQNNPEYHAQYNAQWNRDNPEYKKEYNAKWYQDNKERKIKQVGEYNRKRYHSDPLYNMLRRLRSRTKLAFKAKGWKKDSSTQKMLGCDWETLKIHMESQFKDGMLWDNMGEWEIDHIIPLSTAQTEDELKKLSHYTNLQPLWAGPNRTKSNKVLKEHYDLHYKLLGRYYK